MEAPIFYSKAEFIETVCIIFIINHDYPTYICLGHGKQSVASCHYCWATEHHSRRQDHHLEWCHNSW